MQRRPDFSFPGSPARGLDRALPPRPPLNTVPPRPAEEEEIRWLQASRQGSPDCYYSSGTPSPPLWAHHDHDHRPYPASAGSSPSSRAQAIAGYRREMLDLVRGLPESAYELSLRDIVEQHHPSSLSAPLPTPPPLPPSPPPLAPHSNANAAVARGHEPATNTAAVEQRGAKQSGAASKKQGRKQRAVRRQKSRSLERSVSLDTGLLIKFFLPLSIRGGKKKVSPKPDAAANDAKKKKKKQGTKKEEAKQKQDEEWGTKSEFSEAGSSSRNSSTGSSSTASVRNGGGNGGNSNPRTPVRSRSRKRNGCYAFFRAHKSRNGVSQD